MSYSQTPATHEMCLVEQDTCNLTHQPEAGMPVMEMLAVFVA